MVVGGWSVCCVNPDLVAAACMMMHVYMLNMIVECYSRGHSVVGGDTSAILKGMVHVLSLRIFYH